MQWEQWYKDLSQLSDFKVSRCLKPLDFGPIVSAHFHTFSDASETGYGSVTYLRLENEHQMIHCSFVIDKTRVAPLKQISIPRLELTAATVAVRTSKIYYMNWTFILIA